MRYALPAAAAAALLASITAADAADLRAAQKADPTALDVSAQWDANTENFVLNFYDPLLDFDGKNFVPMLAERWEMVEPRRWRFWLRKGVTFHDGRAFTADDVIFSIARAGAESSRNKTVVRGIVGTEKIDDHTVDVMTDSPRPFLINMFDRMAIMSRGWAVEKGAALPADLSKNQQNAALREANGTGPYKLELREPDRQTVAIRNQTWWNRAAYPQMANKVTLVPIGSDASRVAALLSGEIDVIAGVPLQDTQRIERQAGIKLWSGQEARAVFLGFDVSRPELLYSSVKGRNPFADKRVREAVARAIDNDAIIRVVTRGFAKPANMIIPPGVIGYEPDRQRLPLDPEGAKRLLAEAGYPDGFTVQLDCSVDRDVADSATCEAIAPMLARVGIKIELRARPSGPFLTSLLGRDVSFFRFSWGNNGWASSNTLGDMVGCKEPGKHGFNTSGYCNPKLDELVNRINAESDRAAGLRYTKEAWDIVDQERLFVPLHYPPIFFASRDPVEAVNVTFTPQLRWVGVKVK